MRKKSAPAFALALAIAIAFPAAAVETHGPTGIAARALALVDQVVDKVSAVLRVRDQQRPAKPSTPTSPAVDHMPAELEPNG